MSHYTIVYMHETPPLYQQKNFSTILCRSQVGSGGGPDPPSGGHVTWWHQLGLDQVGVPDPPIPS